MLIPRRSAREASRATPDASQQREHTRNDDGQDDQNDDDGGQAVENDRNWQNHKHPSDDRLRRGVAVLSRYLVPSESLSAGNPPKLLPEEDQLNDRSKSPR
jgi:hypothetical protein